MQDQDRAQERDERPENQAEETTAADAAGADAAPESGSAEERIRELEHELGLARARYQDFRRRSEREQQKLRLLVAKDLWHQVLPIVDNFGAALSALDKGQDAEQVLVGVKMIHHMMERLLTDNGVQSIAAVGESFDPSVHEAIGREDSPEHAPNTVIAEIQRGYRLGDLVIRPAKVTVAQAAEENGDGSSR
ncbi:MAG: nucleotide exchange factor GrpE [Planctomycetota bacterium]